MQYALSNDELFFLCALTGANEILGLENPAETLGETETNKRWSEVSSGLYKTEILHKTADGKVYISDEYAKVVAAIAFPDTVFGGLVAEAQPTYVYIKGPVYIQLIRKETCEIKVFESREEFVEFLNQELMFEATEKEFSLILPTAVMEKGMEMYVAGEEQTVIDSFVTIGISKEILLQALAMLADNTNSKSFVGYKNNQESPSKAQFKTVKSADGTWLFKITNEYTKICRCGTVKALAEVVSF